MENGQEDRMYCIANGQHEWLEDGMVMAGSNERIAVQHKLYLFLRDISATFAKAIEQKCHRKLNFLTTKGLEWHIALQFLECLLYMEG
jgi:hypothetical protein